MGIREWWSESSTGVQVAVVLGVIVGGLVFTVIAAAVLGAFVLGLGGSAPVAPQASFSVDSTSGGDAVTIVHSGGDSIDASSLTVEIGDRTVSWSADDGTVDAGDELDVEDVSEGTVVTLVWTGPEGEDRVLMEYVV